MNKKKNKTCVTAQVTHRSQIFFSYFIILDYCQSNFSSVLLMIITG